MYRSYISSLKSRLIPYKKDLSLAAYCTFSVGGYAKIAVFPESVEDLSLAVLEAKKLGIRYTVIGNGSNVLFSDEGFDGVIIFTSACKKAEVKGNRIYAECGVSFTHLASLACRNSLSGLEFAYGIPGTVGGAVYMNAGAYGGEVSNVLLSSECFDCNTGKTVTLSAEEHGFDYRTSVYAKNEDLIALSAVFELKYGESDTIKATMSELMAKRRDKQPLEFPSAGSTFKRPNGYFAGKLIEDSGLKGFSIGGAQVSEKHAGFVINRGGATSKEVLSLIDHIKKTVMDNFGVELECEIKYID